MEKWGLELFPLRRTDFLIFRPFLGPEAPEFRVPNPGTEYPPPWPFNRGVGGAQIYPDMKGKNEDWKAKWSDMERNQAADKASSRINCNQKLDFCPRLYILYISSR